MTGPELYAIRQTLGWTQERLAAQVGYTPNYYAQCERGERPINARLDNQMEILRAVHRLCELLGFGAHAPTPETPTAPANDARGSLLHINRSHPAPKPQPTEVEPVIPHCPLNLTVCPHSASGKPALSSRRQQHGGRRKVTSSV